MEENKMRYLQDFLNRTDGITIEDILRLIKKREADLRNCYAKTISLVTEKFIELILIDAVFLVEILLRWSNTRFRTRDDPIFANLVIKDVVTDIWCLENQLPKFILIDLFEFAKLKGICGKRYKEIHCEFCRPMSELLLIKKDQLEEHFLLSNHFLDLLRLCLQPPHKYDVSEFTLNSPSITELHQSGVKFECMETDSSLLDIKFVRQDGILRIPKLKIGNETEVLLANIQAFESLHCKANYLNDYIIFLSFLVNSPKEVELLVQGEVIESRIWGSEQVSAVLNKLARNARLSNESYYYSSLVEDLKTYSKSKVPWKYWMTILKKNYFNTPWTSISVFAASILLLLTLIQAVCSVIAVL